MRDSLTAVRPTQLAVGKQKERGREGGREGGREREGGEGGERERERERGRERGEGEMYECEYAGQPDCCDDNSTCCR